LDKYFSLNKEKKRVEKNSTRYEKVQKMYEELGFLIFLENIYCGIKIRESSEKEQNKSVSA
jgi:hypothetical protein